MKTVKPKKTKAIIAGAAAVLVVGALAGGINEKSDDPVKDD